MRRKGSLGLFVAESSETWSASCVLGVSIPVSRLTTRIQLVCHAPDL